MKAIKSLLLALYLLTFYAPFALGGCIKGDCTNGQGAYTYSDGSVYDGQWKSNKRSGHGTLTRPKGSRYVGHWDNDTFDGQGTYTYPDGSKYVGQWKNNKRNGEGRYTSSSGSKYEGQWNDGRLIGEGILITSDGNKFVGQFDKNGKLVGKYLPLAKKKLSGASTGVDLDKEKNETEISSKFEEKVKKPRLFSNKKTLTGPNGINFIYISPGSFMMGSPVDESGRYENETQHQVTLTHGFYLQTTEVTQGQWAAVMKGNPSFFSSCGDECPVEQVSWDDVEQFIRKLNQLDGAKYRLPTEAEWEYACRAGNTEAFANGGITDLECNRDSNLDTVAWFCGNSDKTTHAVAQKKPNALGLYDMHGNVSELCQDWYGDYPSSQTKDPHGPASGIDRVVRGGGWDAQARHCRSACRGALSPGEHSYGVGFRLVRTP